MDEAGHEKNADTITKRQTNVAKLYFMTIADQSFDFSFTMNGGTSSFQNNKEGGFAAFNEFLNEQRHQILRNSVSSIKWYVNGKNQGWTQNNYETGSNASGTLKKLLDAVSELRQVYGSEKNINLNVVAFGCGATRGKIFLNKIPVERKGSASIRLNKAVFYDLVPCNQER